MNVARDPFIRAWGRSLVSWAALTALAVLLAGCRQEGPQVYRVPKEAAASPSTSATASPHGAPAGTALPELGWAVPEGWTERAGSGMSLADFSAGSEAGVSIIPLPARGVSDVEVINIFRQRFQLRDLDADGLKALGREVTTAPAGTMVYDMTAEAAGEGPRLMIAVVPHAEARWYVRLSGEGTAVEREKTNFLQFVGSLTVEGPPAASAAPASGSGTVAAAPASAGESGAEPLPEWTVPPGWKAAPLTTMVLARFLVGEPGQRVEVTVSAFPGDVGGLAANVNRWRRQVGLGAVPEAEAVASLLPVKTVDGEGWLVDLNGSMQGRDAVMVGAILPRGGRTWFYKMVGDPAASKANREAFVEFLRASRHPSS